MAELSDMTNEQICSVSTQNAHRLFRF